MATGLLLSTQNQLTKYENITIAEPTVNTLHVQQKLGSLVDTFIPRLISYFYSGAYSLCQKLINFKKGFVHYVNDKGNHNKW